MRRCASTARPSASSPTTPKPSTTGASRALQKRRLGRRARGLQPGHPPPARRCCYLQQPGPRAQGQRRPGWRARGLQRGHPPQARLSPSTSTTGASRAKAKGDLDGALADYDQAIRLKPDFAEAFNGRGVARHSQRRLGRRARRLQPGHPPPARLRLGHRRIANLCSKPSPTAPNPDPYVSMRACRCPCFFPTNRQLATGNFLITHIRDPRPIAAPAALLKSHVKRTRDLCPSPPRPHADTNATAALANLPPSGISSTCHDTR